MTIQLTVRSVTYQQSPSAHIARGAATGRLVRRRLTGQRVDRVTRRFSMSCSSTALHHQIGDHTALVSTGKCPVEFLLHVLRDAEIQFLATVASSFECSYALLIRMVSSTTA